MQLASTGDTTPAEAIGQLLNYLPIYGFAGGAMTQLDASAVLDWATAGIGATALAQRWNSPLLVEVNEHTLAAVLEHPGLLATLEQIEDFRALVNNAEHVVTSTTILKKAKREQGGKLDPEQTKQQSETAKQRKEIREKLQKFLAKIPVFMYATDFREEALKHVVESLDSALFERVTGLTVDDFKLLNKLGLFNAQHMNAAIYQFKSFETASLHYADGAPPKRLDGKVGLWDDSIDASELHAGRGVERAGCSCQSLGPPPRCDPSTPRRCPSTSPEPGPESGPELRPRTFRGLEPRHTRPNGPRLGSKALTCGLASGSGADDGIRTRDPHLGKVTTADTSSRPSEARPPWTA